MDKRSNWKTEVEKIVQCNQRQDSEISQLSDLYIVANKLGFYDAADHIKRYILGVTSKE